MRDKLRELDADLFRLLGYEVLGWLSCSCPEGDWWIEGEEYSNKKNKYLEPVYISQCECEQRKEWHEEELQEAREKGDEEEVARYLRREEYAKKAFGHYTSCLDVVPYITKSRGAVFKYVVDKLSNKYSFHCHIDKDIQMWSCEFGDEEVFYGKDLSLTICRAAFHLLKEEGK